MKSAEQLLALAATVNAALAAEYRDDKISGDIPFVPAVMVCDDDGQLLSASDAIVGELRLVLQVSAWKSDDHGARLALDSRAADILAGHGLVAGERDGEGFGDGYRIADYPVAFRAL